MGVCGGGALQAKTNIHNEPKGPIEMDEETVKVYPEDQQCLSDIMAASAKTRSYKAQLMTEMVESTAAVGRLFGWTQVINNGNSSVDCYLKDSSVRFRVFMQDGYLNFYYGDITGNQYQGLFCNTLNEYVHDKQDGWFFETNPQSSGHNHFTNGVVIDRMSTNHKDNQIFRLRIPYKFAVEQKALKQILGIYVGNMHARIANESMPRPENYNARVEALGLNKTFKI